MLMPDLVILPVFPANDLFSETPKSQQGAGKWKKEHPGKLRRDYKKSLANVCWMLDKNTSGFYANYVKTYRRRFEKMRLSTQKADFDGSMLEMALRFTVFQPDVTSAIIGTTNLDHIRKNIEMIKKGPLDDQVISRIRDIWKEKNDGSGTGQT